MKTPVSRLTFIDALRGIAALYVIFFHINQKPQVEFADWIVPLVSNGYTGVQLFFIVSAFTLCYTFFGRRNEPGEIRRFYLRRICRIVPLYYCWLAAMLVWLWGTWNYGSLLRYLSFTFNFVPGEQSGFIWLSWTLAVEMIFYLFFPFIIRLVNTLERSVLFIVASFLLSYIHYRLFSSIKDYNVSMGLLHHLPVFAIGITTFFISKKLKLSMVRASTGTWLIVAGLAGIVTTAYFPQGLVHVYIISLFYAVLLIGLLITPVKILVNRFTIFAGLISYSLYLSHPLIIHYFVVKNKFVAVLDLQKPFTIFFCVMLILASVFAVSYLTYKLIEQPGIAWGRKFTGRRTKKDVIEEDIAI